MMLDASAQAYPLSPSFTSGYTALDWAISEGSVTVAALLTSKGVRRSHSHIITGSFITGSFTPTILTP
jgi:hypothetical protein